MTPVRDKAELDGPLSLHRAFLFLWVNRACQTRPSKLVDQVCARAYLGGVEWANLVKLHRFSGKASYLVYPAFDAAPHPTLARSVKLSLRSRELCCQDYTRSENPPVLHRKETVVLPDHPLREKFARLTRQEEQAGLLDDTPTIGTRAGWQARLAERGYRLRGHRIVREVKSNPGGDQAMPDLPPNSAAASAES
jgi:DNA phosphorothioation-associated putative methyltransferase